MTTIEEAVKEIERVSNTDAIESKWTPGPPTTCGLFVVEWMNLGGLQVFTVVRSDGELCARRLKTDDDREEPIPLRKWAIKQHIKLPLTTWEISDHQQTPIYSDKWDFCRDREMESGSPAQ